MPAIPPPALPQARAFLASTVLFAGLEAPALDALAAELEWVLVPGGGRVFSQGDPGDALYLVAGGRLVVVREGPMAPRRCSGRRDAATPSARWPC